MNRSLSEFRISSREKRMKPDLGRICILSFVIYLLSAVMPQEGFAQGPSANPKKEIISKEAVQSTQQNLRNEKARSQIIGESKAAQANDQKTSELAGSSENKEKIYDISADIMANFEGKSVEEMEAILNQASKDPEGFMRSLTPEQRAKIKEISQQIETSKKNP